MAMLTLTAPVLSHLLHVVSALQNSGWKVKRVPAVGRLARNGQKMLLESDGVDLRFRLFVYKVTGSSRNRPDERRIEITSTYEKGLQQLDKYPDIVLGYEPEKNLFVGVDSERIRHGGKTGNASSFFDIKGLALSHLDSITILQRKAKEELFPAGVEYHAFFAPIRIAEYLFNNETIHAGTYAGNGDYSGDVKQHNVPFGTIDKEFAGGDVLVLSGPTATKRGHFRKIKPELVEDFESGQLTKKNGKPRKITPEELLELQRIMAENGRLGEEFVVAAERKRLRKKGLPAFAEKVQWISQESVGEGYDIVSFESDGTEKYIEVKSTVGTRNTFEMSDNEWSTACRLKDQYYICRVVNVRKKARLRYERNPQLLEQQGKVTKISTGWRVTLN